MARHWPHRIRVKHLCVPTPAFRVVGMDGATAEGGDRVLDKSRFVQRVGVNRHLYIVFFCHAQATVDGGWRCAPVLVQLQPQGPASICSRSGCGMEPLPLPRNPKLIGYSSAACNMRYKFQDRAYRSSPSCQ